MATRTGSGEAALGQGALATKKEGEQLFQNMKRPKA